MTFGVLNGQYFSTMTTTTRSATRKAGRRMRVNRQITRFTLDCEPQSTCDYLHSSDNHRRALVLVCELNYNNKLGTIGKKV